MKFYKILFLLFLIVSQSLITLQTELKVRKSKLSLKRNKGRSKRNTNSASARRARASAMIRDGLSVSFEMESDEDVLDFCLGAMAVYYPPTEILYTNKEKVKSIIKVCTDAKKFEPEKVKVNTAPSTITTAWETMDASEKFSYCKSRKKFFLDISQRTIGWLLDECIVTASEFNNVSSKVPRISNLDEYKKECTYFKDMDCDMFKDGVDALGFISKAMSYVKPVKSTISCIVNLKEQILQIPEFKDLADALTEGGILAVLGTVGGIAAMILTLGIWNLAKGAYQLVKLSKQIYDFVTMRQIKIRSFMLGKITAEAIKLGQSLFTGTRRKRKSSKK